MFTIEKRRDVKFFRKKLGNFRTTFFFFWMDENFIKYLKSWKKHDCVFFQAICSKSSENVWNLGKDVWNFHQNLSKKKICHNFFNHRGAVIEKNLVRKNRTRFGQIRKNLSEFFKNLSKKSIISQKNKNRTIVFL